MKYPKIQSIFKRDPEDMKHFLLGQYTTPEFEYLANNEWIFTEKVDGTNIRYYGSGGVYGRTDEAEIPPFLLDKLDKYWEPIVTFTMGADVDVLADICFYGEGYGPRIQKGGGNYGLSVDFVVFDIRIGDWWLKRPDVESICKQVGLDVVPIVGQGTLQDGINLVKDGFKSQWGDFEAEGIVAFPKVQLFNRKGERIITKIKTKDFRY